ncbi:hypothetical protein GDO81_018582 [Engystomops pustulosus]|uniref:Uncharacterized protein n=1 Tax=Engystomops pustulosus TaxID=76066 RepID=A0AAV6Z0K9_ENGPU|nr:hypothetical protein GDO81_018582 [Engystomops pustulosus]
MTPFLQGKLDSQKLTIPYRIIPLCGGKCFGEEATGESSAPRPLLGKNRSSSYGRGIDFQKEWLLGIRSVRTFNFWQNQGTVSRMNAEAIIRAIPKQDNPRPYPENYRLLINCDLKIYAKILPNKLEKIIPSLISTGE